MEALRRTQFTVLKDSGNSDIPQRGGAMEHTITFDIPYIGLNFYAEILNDTRMPETKTAALRGGMGEMLLRQNCVADRKCETCGFRKACVVSHTFYSAMEKKPSYVTSPESVGYLIECTDTRTHLKKGGRFEFTLSLFGDSIVFFNIYLQAFCQLGMSGLGKDRARFRISEVRNTQGKTIVRDNEVDMSRYCIDTVSGYVKKRKEKLLRRTGDWELTFMTPLSMKYQQKYMEKFYGEALVKGAARRIQMLNYYIGTEADVPEFFVYPEIRTQSVSRETVRRYSGTQDSRMALRGISGTVIFDTMPEECLDYLIAGELTHMGRNTSFGFGKYILGRNS